MFCVNWDVHTWISRVLMSVRQWWSAAEGMLFSGCPCVRDREQTVRGNFIRFTSTKRYTVGDSDELGLNCQRSTSPRAQMCKNASLRRRHSVGWFAADDRRVSWWFRYVCRSLSFRNVKRCVTWQLCGLGVCV